MTLEGGNITQQLQRYTDRCREYLQNSYASLEQNEVEKAGEFLWGSMAQAIKAVAASKNIELRSHAAIWEYARGLSKDLEDPALFDAFRNADSLHRNFYESGLTREIVLTSGERIRYAVGMLMDMIPREALEG
jgi:uncharacterized protein (UPF0332 family)